MDNFSPATIAIITVIITVLGSVMTTLSVQFFNARKNKEETEKTRNEARLIRRKLKEDDASDLAWFIDTFYELVDLSYGMIITVERILAEHPDINSGTPEKVAATKQCLKVIRDNVRSYFDSAQKLSP